MASVSDLYDLYLSADMLPPGRVVTVVITRVEDKVLHPKPGQEARRLVLSFKDKTRKLVLNRGNADRLAVLFGEDYTAWPGAVIGLVHEQYTKTQATIKVTPAPAGGK